MGCACWGLGVAPTLGEDRKLKVSKGPNQADKAISLGLSSVGFVSIKNSCQYLKPRFLSQIWLSGNPGPASRSAKVSWGSDVAGPLKRATRALRVAKVPSVLASALMLEASEFETPAPGGWAWKPRWSVNQRWRQRGVNWTLLSADTGHCSKMDAGLALTPRWHRGDRIGCPDSHRAPWVL